MKIFISQPMRGKTDEQIVRERLEAIEKIKSSEHFKGQDIEIIDSILDHETRALAQVSKNPRVFNLGESLKLLSDADVLILMPGYDEADGCVVEGFVAKVYGIETLKLNKLK